MSRSNPTTRGGTGGPYRAARSARGRPAGRSPPPASPAWSHPADRVPPCPEQVFVSRPGRARCTAAPSATPRRRSGSAAARSAARGRPWWRSARRPSPDGSTAAAGVVMPLAEVDPIAAAGRPTGVPELDRVLGGGLVPGSVTLLGGEPGIGKSTLLLQAMGRMAAAGTRCLLVCAEESVEQVRLRAGRLQALAPSLLVVAETSLPAIADRVREIAPDVLAVDSIQTVFDPEIASAPGSVGQVREGAHRLVRLAKERAMATVLVGHVTKDGSLAGPRALEHVVDTVLAFEGDRHHALRMLHALKHRYGTTNELGVFEMAEAGMTEVADPSAMFLADRAPGLPGLGGHRDDGGRAPAAGRGAGADVARRAPGAAPLGARARRRAARDAARGARGARRLRGGRVRRLRERRRRLPRAGRGLRRRGHGRGRERPHRARPSPRGWSRSARSGSVASCARRPRPPGGSARRPGSGSAPRSSPRRRRTSPGIRLLRAEHIGDVLTALELR